MPCSRSLSSDGVLGVDLIKTFSSEVLLLFACRMFLCFRGPMQSFPVLVWAKDVTVGYWKNSM